MSHGECLRRKYSVLRGILDSSEPTFTAFCADLYEKEIIDRAVKNSVLRKKGFDELITHLEVMVEQDSDCLPTVLQVMENHQLLKPVATDIKKETNSSEELLQGVFNSNGFSIAFACFGLWLLNY